MHFLCHDTTLKKLSIEKLDLTWKKQINFHKLGPLPRVFQIVLTGRRMGNLPGGIFLSGGRNLTRSDFGQSNLFQS